MEEKRQGKVITFYSYKGGTGRSMTLANVAWILASNGKKVLMIDWDIEAPGLHRYFSPFLVDRELTNTEGLMDFVLDFCTETMTPTAEGETDDPEWYLKHADILPYTVSLDWNFGEGTLDFICAGRQDAAYSTRVNTFDWRSFYERQGGGVFLEAARRQAKAEYDYVLIDSRTGVSDTSGICTVQAPDVLVVCFTLNNQSIDGAANVAASVFQQRRALEQQHRLPPVEIFPVPMRVEMAEKDKLKARRKFARQRFALFPDALSPQQRESYWNDVEIIYEPYYAYEEVLVTFGDEPGVPASMLGALERLTGHLTDGEVTRAVALPAEERAAVLARFARRGAAEIAQDELQDEAEAVFAELSPDDQQAAQRLFTSLVRVAPREEYGRITGLRVPIGRLAFARDAVRRFVAADLLKLAGDDTSGEETVQFASEALIEKWTRLKEWIEADRDFLLWRQQLRVFLADWQANQRDERGLITGPALEVARGWAERRGSELAEEESAFINASSAYETALLAERQRASQRLQDATKEAATLSAPKPATRPWQAAFAGLVVLLLGFGLASYFSRSSTGTPVQVSTQMPAPADTGASELVREADSELQAGRVDAAIALYDKALTAVPNNAAWLLKRGAAYEQLGETAKAAADYDAAIAADGKYADAYLSRAALRYASKDFAGAIADYSRVIELTPDNPDAYFNRAVTRDAAGDREAAVVDYGEALKRKPDYAAAYFNRGVNYESAGKAQLAERDFEAILSLNADAQTLAAAQARLTRLVGPSKAPPALRPVKQASVFVHYNDPADAERMKAITSALARARFNVPPPEQLTVKSRGDVRFFFKADQEAALETKKAVELALAKHGLPVDLLLRELNPADFKEVEPGRIEVWLPSLSQRISIQNRSQTRN